MSWRAKEKAPDRSGAFVFALGEGLVHAVHAAAAVAVAAAGASFFSGISEIMASVVSIRPAMEAAFCSAVRVTLVGSMTPALTRSSYLPVPAL